MTDLLQSVALIFLGVGVILTSLRLNAFISEQREWTHRHTRTSTDDITSAWHEENEE